MTRYLRELLSALVRLHPDDEWHLFLPGRGPILLDPGPNLTIRRHRVPGRLLFGAAAVSGRPRLDRLVGGDVDVLWAPTIAPIAVSADVPLVLTIQDLSFELRPADFTSYERVWHRLARPRALARGAARVIVLAAPTRAELVARWGLDPARIEVVAPGVSLPAPVPPAGAAAAAVAGGAGSGARPYLLAVGALEPRKAPELLVRAFAAARAQGLRARLVFAGEGRLAGALVAEGVTVLGRVSDAELDGLYRGAAALVMASLLEGYGLPVREALARGTPAVVSDLPVFGPELDSALLRVAPGDEASLAAALLRLEREAGLRDGLAAAAADAVAGLSWDEAARRTRAILAEAAAVAP